MPIISDIEQRDAKIINCRVVGKETFAEIAKKYNLSVARIQQICGESPVRTDKKPSEVKKLDIQSNSHAFR